jgi:hypothetical protein
MSKNFRSLSYLRKHNGADPLDLTAERDFMKWLYIHIIGVQPNFAQYGGTKLLC